MITKHLCLLFITLCPFIFRGTNQEPLPLEAGKSVARELAGDQSHAYTLALAADQYLHIVVEPRGIDVAIRLFGTDGKLIAEVDTPFAGEEPEKVSLVAETAGNFRLEAHPSQKDAKPGSYTLKVVEARAATAADRNRVAAERIFAEAEKLKAQPAAGDQRKAIERHLESLPLWRAASDRAGEANTLNSIGEGYYFLREAPKAIDYYDQALVVWRAAGDRKGEAITLNNLGAAYKSLGERQKALDYQNQALLIRRSVGDRRGEATTLHNLGDIYGSMGAREKALEFFNQALPLRRSIGDRSGEATTLNGIGQVYDSLGERQKALEHFNQALALRRAIGDRRGDHAHQYRLGSRRARRTAKGA
jgi:tetratricopeptide (TPR) repeat protein